MEPQQPESAFSRALSGVLGGIVANTVMHPVDLVQKRIQVSKQNTYNGIIDALFKTAHQNGFAGLYDGLLMSYVSNVTKNTVFFSAYETLKATYPPQSTAQQLAYGMASGAVTTLFTVPLQVITTQLNVNSNRGARLSALDVLRSVVGARGFFGLYVGLVPGMVLCVYPAIQHTIFDRLKRWYFAGHEAGKELPMALAFVFGMAANITALLLTYPLIYVKCARMLRFDRRPFRVAVALLTLSPQVRVQAQRNGRLGSIAMASKIVRDAGLLGLWQGLQSQIASACLASAIMLSTKEKVQELALMLTRRK